MLSPGSLVCALGRQADAPMDGRPSFDEVPPRCRSGSCCASVRASCGHADHDATLQGRVLAQCVSVSRAASHHSASERIVYFPMGGYARCCTLPSRHLILYVDHACSSLSGPRPARDPNHQHCLFGSVYTASLT